MSPNVKKTVIFSLLGLVAVAVAIGLYFYNKGPVDVKHAISVKVPAIELYEAFSKDSVTANMKFGNKIIETTGWVSQVSQNQQNQAIVMLKTNDEGAFVNCTMEGPATTIKEKETIIIKGICTGMLSGDLGLPGDVYLGRCYLVR
jgi:cytochrome c-type biogenesis protein CcmE